MFGFHRGKCTGKSKSKSDSIRLNPTESDHLMPPPYGLLLKTCEAIHDRHKINWWSTSAESPEINPIEMFWNESKTEHSHVVTVRNRKFLVDTWPHQMHQIHRSYSKIFDYHCRTRRQGIRTLEYRLSYQPPRESPQWKVHSPVYFGRGWVYVWGGGGDV